MQATDVATILRPQSPYIYSHGRAAMLRPLRTHAFRTVVVAGELGQLSYTPACITLIDNCIHAGQMLKPTSAKWSI